MSSEQRPEQPAHSQVPEIPRELLTARPLGSYEDVPPGESFKVYFENGPRFIEPGTAAVQDKGHNTRHFTFRRLDEGESEWHGWEVRTEDGVAAVQLEGSTTYFERSTVLSGVVKALQFFTFSTLRHREIIAKAPDGDTFAVPVGQPEGRVTIGPIFCVEWPWGKVQVTNSDLKKKNLLK